MAGLSPTARGILLMLSAILFFSAMDAMGKYLVQTTEVIQVVWARYLGQMVVVGVVLAPRLPLLVRTNNLRLQLLRSGCLFGATVCFFSSFQYMDIAAATAVMNIHPILLTLGAALILKEAMGPRRIFGIGLALIGALIIIRPGTDVFTWAALLPLAGGTFYASYALTTRFLGRDEPILTSFIYTALIGALVATVLVWPVWEAPTAREWGIYLLLGVVAAIGQFLLIKSLTTAEASVVAPFGYSGVVFATCWGLFAFGEVPDAWTLVGALVIILAGVYVWHRETRARAKAASP
jgi:drug/metabolite transporter (DMT)-like permease